MPKQKRKQAESDRKNSADDRGQLLRVFRKSYGVALKEITKLTGLSQPMLTRFETGTRKLSADAWGRVESAITRIREKKEAARTAELAKAQQTAAKLGGPFQNLFGVFADPQSPEGKEYLQKLGEATSWLAEEERKEAERWVQAELGSSATGEALSREWNEHIATSMHPQLLEYAKKVTQERDALKARVAELEQELRSLKEPKQ